MIQHPALLIEVAFDSEQVDFLESSVWPQGLELVHHFRKSDWAAVYKLAGQIVHEQGDPIAKGFAIQWAISASESEFDMVRREQLLGLWANVENWQSNSYCRYLKAYQDALTRFFAGSLRDAGISFRQAHDMAQAMGYQRGIMRCLFHLGLVEKDRGDFSLALELFQHASAIAEAGNAIRFFKRIAPFLEELKDPGQEPQGNSFVAGRAQIERMLIGRDFAGAKAALLSMEAKRRKLRYGRKRESLGIYLSLIYRGIGRERIGFRLLDKIPDPVLKLQVLQLSAKIWPASKKEESEIQYLQESLGVSQVVFYRDAKPNDTEISGVKLESIKQESVRSFLLFLLKNPGPQSKEKIAVALWNVRYDPTNHDKKVYKLVLQTKKAIGVAELLLNTYGSYEIHPRLLGKRSKAS